MELAPAQAEHEGRGYVQSDDVVNAGFTQGETRTCACRSSTTSSRVLDDYEGVDITRLTRELSPKSPYGAQPDAHHRRRRADRRSGPQLFRHPALHRRRARQGEHPVPLRQSRVAAAAAVVAALRSVVAVRRRRADEPPVADPVRFRMYANYATSSSARRCESSTRSSRVQATPLRRPAVDPDGFAEWQPDVRDVPAPARELKYVLRAYDDEGNFDETMPQPLWILREERQASPCRRRGRSRRDATPRQRRLQGAEQLRRCAGRESA